MRRPGLFRRFVKDREGVSAVEFALLAPVIALIYLGVAEICQAVMAQRRVSHAAATMADLTTRTAKITTAELEDIFAVGDVIMRPFPTKTLGLRVTSLTADASGKVTVAWTASRGSAPAAPTAAPAGLLGPNESLIIAQTVYSYDSSLDKFLPGLSRFAATYHLRPRASDKVTRV